MVAGIFHQGSGIGNQLFRYVAARTLAADKGYSFGMVAPENFKGSSFMNLDMGVPVQCTWTLGEGGKVIPISSMASWEEKKITENGVDIRGYDPDFNFVKDNTMIDGEFQDERYFTSRLGQVSEWLRTESLGMPDNVCVVGFRGGEFAAVPDLFLPREYWTQAIAIMRTVRRDMEFLAVTDDPDTAARILPKEVKITHEIGDDWRRVRSANYLIIANSSFYILPALLNNHVKKVIAPKYWARRNTDGPWACTSNFYKKFSYI